MLLDLEVGEGLDDLMAVQESVNPVLFSKYKSARGIDNIMGGSGSSDGYLVQSYTIPGSGSMLVPLGPGPIPPEGGIYIRSVQGDVIVCTTNLPASPCASGYNALQGVTYKGPIGGLGLDLNLTNLQITNPGLSDAIVRIGPEE